MTTLGLMPGEAARIVRDGLRKDHPWLRLPPRPNGPLTVVETEMAWTTWADSCRHRDIDAPDLRQCRRRVGHPTDDGGHASGFGDGLRRWAA